MANATGSVAAAAAATIAATVEPSDVDVYIAYAAIGLMAVVPIYIGAFAGIKDLSKKRKSSKSKKDDDAADDSDEDDEDDEYFTFDDAKWYPVVGSVTLFGMYLVLKFVSKDVINLILTACFTLMGVSSVFEVVLEGLRWISGLSLVGEYAVSLTKNKKKISGFKFGAPHGITLLLASALGFLYFYSKHWLLSNVIGESLSIGAIKLLNLDSFATGMVLLAGLFFYDVFWVFGTDVMVTVAKGLDVPIKVVFPRGVMAVLEQGIWNKPVGVQFSMLGLGDIVIPGIFIALCLKFDHYQFTQSLKGKRGVKPTKWYPTPYFTTCLVMYILGLALTIFIMHTFKAAQPALLYLSPACIISALGVALVRGELKQLFDYAPNPNAAEGKPTITTSASTKRVTSRRKSDDATAVAEVVLAKGVGEEGEEEEPAVSPSRRGSTRVRTPKKK